MNAKQTLAKAAGNQILARLPMQDRQRLQAQLQPVELKFKQLIYRARSAIDYVYFPDSGVLSAITILNDGRSIEVANVGNEGVAGMTALFGIDISPNEVIVQVAGAGWRIRVSAFKAEAERDGLLRQILRSYHTAYLTQISYSVACNGLHPIRQRCCRWILMTHDRVQGDTLHLTNEFLAIMLDVRRASVTEVLAPLKAEGLIKTGRGTITILDRAGLEAACCECLQSVKDEHKRLLG